MDVAAQIRRDVIAAQEDRLDDLAEFGKCRIGRVLDSRAGEAAQDRFGVGGAMFERCGIFDHLVILPLDQGPVDLARQDRREIAERSAHSSEEHTSELQSLMRNSYAVFCLKKKKTINRHNI